MPRIAIANNEVRIPQEDDEEPNLFLASLDPETKIKLFVCHMKVSSEIYVNIFSVCEPNGKINCAFSYNGQAEVEITTDFKDFLRENFDFLYDYVSNFTENSPQDEFLSLGSDLLDTIVQSEGKIPDRISHRFRSTKRSV